MPGQAFPFAIVPDHEMDLEDFMIPIPSVAVLHNTVSQ
jgi:hypothetical protein